MRFAPIVISLVIAPVVAPARAPADASAPVPAPPPDARYAALVARLPVTAGPVPGAGAITIKQKPSEKHCGGVAIRARIRVSRSAPRPDPELAAVFALRFPGGLDFNPSRDARRKASTKKFDAWYQSFQAATAAAGRRYRDTIGDSGTAGLDRLVAMGRLAVVARWSAQIIARSELPKNIRTYPAAQDLYCDTLAMNAAPLVDLADDAAAWCRDLAASLAVGPGWWDAACAAP